MNTHYEGSSAEELRDGLALVWEVYDRKSGLMYVVCDGHKDFLMEPTAPPVKVESFWPNEVARGRTGPALDWVYTDSRRRRRRETRLGMKGSSLSLGRGLFWLGEDMTKGIGSRADDLDPRGLRVQQQFGALK